VENACNIYLVGLMGAGKTTVGRHLAKRLGWPFLDSDQLVVERTGVSIPTIFEIEGEAGFRRREKQAILDLSGQANIVLATGGGAVLDADNRQRLMDTGWVVYLDIPPALIFKRMCNQRNRPLLCVDNPLARLEELHVQRDPLYRAAAHHVINTACLDAPVIVRHLLEAFATRREPLQAPAAKSLP